MSLVQKVRHNAGFTLLATNALLLVIVFFTYDPFGLMQKGYQGSDPIVEATQDDITELAITSAEMGGGRIKLVRGALLPKTNADAANEYTWQLQVERDGKTAEFSGDQERINEFFQTLDKAKRYYSIKRTAEKEREFDMGANAEGQFDGLKFQIKLAAGEEHTLYVGKTSVQGNESYVRLDEEDNIYLVQTNLRSAVDSGATDYFRNRKLAPTEMKLDSITAINAIFSRTETGAVVQEDARNIQLSKSGDSWQMLLPVPAEASKTQMSGLLNDILRWKTKAFLGNIPEGLDTSVTFSLEIVYKKNLTEPVRLTYQILGQLEQSSYVVRTEDGTLVELVSVYLADFLNPMAKFVQPQK